MATSLDIKIKIHMMLTVLRWDDPWFHLVIFSSWYNSLCHLNAALSRYTFTVPVSQTWWLNINWALILSFLMIIPPSKECMSLKKVFQSWRNQTELYILITQSTSAKVSFMRNYSYTSLWKNNFKNVYGHLMLHGLKKLLKSGVMMTTPIFF